MRKSVEYVAYIVPLWLGIPSLKKEVETINNLVKKINEVRDDLYFVIKTHSDKRIDKYREEFDNVEWHIDYANHITLRREKLPKFEDMENYSHSFIHFDEWTFQHSPHKKIWNKDYKIPPFIPNENLEADKEQLEILQWLKDRGAYEDVEYRDVISEYMEYVKIYNEDVRASDDYKQSPSLYYLDWDCDIVLNFIPSITALFSNKFYNVTNMSPSLCSIWEKKIWVTQAQLPNPHILSPLLSIGLIEELSYNIFDDKDCAKNAICMGMDGGWNNDIIGEALKRSYIGDISEQIINYIDTGVKEHHTKRILKKVSKPYRKIIKAIKDNGSITKRELWQKKIVNWGRTIDFQQYRNRLRADKRVRFVGKDTYEWVDKNG